MKFLPIVTLLVLLFSSTMANPSPFTDAEQVLEGVLVGAFGNIGKEIRECIVDGEEIFKDIKQAVKFFKAGGAANIVKGLEAVGEALALVPEEVKDCEALPDLVKDFEKIAEEFMNPEELVIHVGEEIIWHGVSIYHDVDDCVKQFERGSYEPAGEDIGDILKILFLTVGDAIEDTKNFLEGFFDGALEADSVDIEECIEDADDIIKEVEVIIADFEKGVTEDLEQLFLDLIDLLTEIPPAVVKCEETPDELNKLIEWAETMKDVKAMESKMFYALLKYPSRLKGDFKDMIESFKSHDYKTSGKSMGDVLHVLFVDVSATLAVQDPVDNAVTFVQHFYKKAFNLKIDLAVCQTQVDEAVHIVLNAVEKIATFEPAKIIQGITDLVDAFPKIRESLKQCESAWPQLQKGLEKLKVFYTKASQIPWAITEAMTLHMWRVTSDTTAIYHFVNDSPHDFAKGGDATGDLIELILYEMGATIRDGIVYKALKN